MSEAPVMRPDGKRLTPCPPRHEVRQRSRACCWPPAQGSRRSRPCRSGTSAPAPTCRLEPRRSRAPACRSARRRGPPRAGGGRPRPPHLWWRPHEDPSAAPSQSAEAVPRSRSRSPEAPFRAARDALPCLASSPHTAASLLRGIRRLRGIARRASPGLVTEPLRRPRLRPRRSYPFRSPVSFEFCVASLIGGCCHIRVFLLILLTRPRRPRCGDVRAASPLPADLADHRWVDEQVPEGPDHRHVRSPEKPIRLNEDRHLPAVAPGPVRHPAHMHDAVDRLVRNLRGPFVLQEVKRAEGDPVELRSGWGLAQVLRQSVAKRRHPRAEVRIRIVPAEQLPKLPPDRPEDAGGAGSALRRGVARRKPFHEEGEVVGAAGSWQRPNVLDPEVPGELVNPPWPGGVRRVREPHGRSPETSAFNASVSASAAESGRTITVNSSTSPSFPT